jgi:uncharacterized membrane protein YqjE
MSDVTPTEATLGELVADVGRDVSTLVRKELELAKIEARSEAATFVRSLGAFAAAGAAAVVCMLMVSTALALWIADGLHVAVSFAIVGAVWLVVGLVAFGAARSAMQRIRPMPETTDAIKSTTSSSLPPITSATPVAPQERKLDDQRNRSPRRDRRDP